MRSEQENGKFYEMSSEVQHNLPMNSDFDTTNPSEDSFGKINLRRRRKLKSLDPPFLATNPIKVISSKRSSYQQRRPVTLTSSHKSNANVHYLPRGGTVVMTEIGAIQFGIPPETIKDSLALNLEVPQFYVVPRERFCCKVGAQQGLNVAEFEFPAYFNFFMKGGKKIVLVVDNESVKACIQQVFQETLLGPENWDPGADFPASYPVEKKPMMMREMKYFQKFGDQQLAVDLLLKFEVLGNSQEVTLYNEKDRSKFVTIFSSLEEYILFDSNRKRICSVSTDIKVPQAHVVAVPRFRSKNRVIGFTPPAFGVTVLGSSHGFDPNGRTSGYVLWINHRGLMIDPPPNSTHLLQKNSIPACLIDAVVVTHCHADHDAGTFQKILQEGKVTLITTPTIMGCFLRKYSALAKLEINFLKTVFKFKPAMIGEKISFHGGKLSFFYTLHSIPCVGFEAYYGGKSIVFSADHMNDPKKINQLYEQGILTKGRRDDLLNFPWHHDLILHEAGVPPIHTPLDTLVQLDDDIKRRLYIVHVSLKALPFGKGLKAAKVGVENTIVLDNVVPPSYSEELLKIDLITGIEIFSELKLKNAADIFTSAKVEKYAKNDYIMKRGEDSEYFFIIQSGVAEVRMERTKSFDDVAVVNEAPQRARTQSESEIEAQTHSFDTDLHNGHVNGVQIKKITVGNNIQTKRESQFKRKKSSVVNMNKAESLEHSPGLDIFAKTYYPGDIFGEKCLISDYGVCTESIVALTKVTLLRCEKKSFLSILQHTNVLTQLRHLERMRERGTLDVIESNSMLRLFSHNQKTQLETCFYRKKFKRGEVVWRAGEACEFAILISSGHMSYTEPRTLYKRRGSGVHLDVNILYGDIHGQNIALPPQSLKGSSSLPDIRFSTENRVSTMSPSHIHNNDTELAIELMHQNSTEETADVKINRFDSNDTDNFVNSYQFKRGGFIGDVDGLFYNGINKVGLKCVADANAYCLMKHDLQKFFKKNPGVLLSMMHTQFIT